MTDFQEVYNLYFRDVYRYALSLCRDEAMAEEITQETFYKALAKLDSYDGKCKISVWLCQIAKNTYISMCRKEKNLDASVDTDIPIPVAILSISIFLASRHSAERSANCIASGLLPSLLSASYFVYINSSSPFGCTLG